MLDELSRLYRLDERRFRSNYASNLEDASQSQLIAKLIFSTHSLEKSLSNDNFEIGRGFHDAYLLTGMINEYLSKGYDKNHLAYINTLSTMRIFYDLHKNTEFAPKVRTILGGTVPLIEACDSEMGGATSVSIDQKKHNGQKNFKQLSEGRYAVRSYSNKPVEKSDIEEVISIATKTPTVCNRQAIRVYVMHNKDVIEAVLKIQGGIVHYDTPPVLLLVTADNNAYVGANERNQGFVDGGLFAMSLLYALEYKGLAACPLHAMLDEEADYHVRGMLDIPEGEKFITFMSAGHFNEDNNVCKSFRYPAEYILVERNKVSEYDAYELVQVDEMECATDGISFYSQLRIKLRIRSRVRSAMGRIKRTVRVRTRLRTIRKIILDTKDRRRFSRADGAIITLPGYYNYGNIIQRFATQKFLQKNGYRFVSYAKDEEMSDSDRRRFKYTYDFIERNIWRKQYDAKDSFDTYIVGSDQVWRKWGYDDIFDELDYCFLGFTKGMDVKRIAYAASIGQDSLKAADYTDAYIPHAGKLVGEFDYVGMRESSGVDIVKAEWGVDAQLVIDPTLLLDASDYNMLIDAAPYEIKKVSSMFTYFILTDEPKRALIARIAKNAGLEDQGIYLESDQTLRPVEEWLAGIRDAQLVVIDSFHGMVFSVIYQTPFVVLESGTGGASRITTLLDALGLSERYIASDRSDSFDIDSLPPIDWEGVSKKLADLQSQSSEWLLEAVRSTKDV